jgi:hypothetical protein
MTDAERINQRISEHPELAQYADILNYDWQDDTHAIWVSTSSLAEIVEWCESIRQDEIDQREIEAIQDPANW